MLVTNGSLYLLVDSAPGRVFDIACLTEQCNNKRRLQRIIRRGICWSILDWDWYVERSCRFFRIVLVTVILENIARDELEPAHASPLHLATLQQLTSSGTI